MVANSAFSTAVVAAGGDLSQAPGPSRPADDSSCHLTTRTSSRALWRDAYDRALAGESFVMETTVPMDDGAHTMENHLHPVRDDDGATVGVVVTSRDITERRRTDEVRAFLARTASGSGDEPFFEALARDLASEPRQWTSSASTGWTPTAWTAHTLAVWTDGHFEDNVVRPQGHTVRRRRGADRLLLPARDVQRSFPTIEVLQDRARELCGAYARSAMPGSPDRPDRSDRPQAAGGSATAETILELVAVRAASELERVDAEEELRETRDYLENLFGYANAPVIVWDADLRITRFNRAFEELTQRSADNEVVGQSPRTPAVPGGRTAGGGAQHVTSATAGERWQVIEYPRSACRRRGADRALELGHHHRGQTAHAHRHHRPRARHHLTPEEASHRAGSCARARRSSAPWPRQFPRSSG